MSTPRQSLTVKLAHAEIRIAQLEALLATATAPKGQTPARIAYLARAKSSEPTPFQMACAAAKAAAMAGGIITRVAH